MKTLNEWNDIKQQESYKDLVVQPQPAGVACNVCGNEMLQKNDANVLASIPPKMYVWCLCGSTGYKVI